MEDKFQFLLYYCRTMFTKTMSGLIYVYSPLPTWYPLINNLIKVKVIQGRSFSELLHQSVSILFRAVVFILFIVEKQCSQWAVLTGKILAIAARLGNSWQCVCNKKLHLVLVKTSLRKKRLKGYPLWLQHFSAYICIVTSAIVCRQHIKLSVSVLFQIFIWFFWEFRRVKDRESFQFSDIW